jgi:hypothetical protein
MLQTCHCPTYFHQTHQDLHLTGGWLRVFGEAFLEGLAAHRHYEQLRSRGLPHDASLRAALGFGPARGLRETARPLYFAGKA